MFIALWCNITSSNGIDEVCLMGSSDPQPVFTCQVSSVMLPLLTFIHTLSSADCELQLFCPTGNTFLSRCSSEARNGNQLLCWFSHFTPANALRWVHASQWNENHFSFPTERNSSACVGDRLCDISARWLELTFSAGASPQNNNMGSETMTAGWRCIDFTLRWEKHRARTWGWGRAVI